MIVIVEGVDGSGKSSLCDALSKLTGYPIYKPTVTPIDESITVEASQAADNASIATAVLTGADLIYDRSFPSEWVYGGAFDRRINTFTVEALDRVCADHGALGIYLRFDKPWMAIHRADGHVPGEDRMRKLIELYDEYVGRSKMRWITIDANRPQEEIVDVAFKPWKEKRMDRHLETEWTPWRWKKLGMKHAIHDRRRWLALHVKRLGERLSWWIQP